uniref:Uncharacterized protein n=1 Tax=Heterorhabditis bacteriophora TaxID=37862 RepID=A0A1I7WNK5_HETBA
MRNECNGTCQDRSNLYRNGGISSVSILANQQESQPNTERYPWKHVFPS